MLLLVLSLIGRILSRDSVSTDRFKYALEDAVPAALSSRWGLPWGPSSQSVLSVNTPAFPSIGGAAKLPSYPLAVKSPYLSAWCPGNQLLIDAPNARPQFWNGIDLRWPVLARIDGQLYGLFDSNGIKGTKAATTTSVSYSSTHTYVYLTAGGVDFELDYFSPVLPGADEYAEHSLPYSYLTVTVNSTSPSPSSVQVLSAIDHSWTAQEGRSDLNYTSEGPAGWFWFRNPDAIPHTQKREMVTHGSVIWGTTTSDSSTTFECGAPHDLYKRFRKTGYLAHNDSSSLQCSGTHLAALAKDIRLSESGSKGVTFVIGHDRAKVINYLDNPQTGFYRTKWPTVQSAVQYVLQSYETVLAASLSFDALIRSKSESVSSSYGPQYADIVEASVRQTFGGIELTVPADNISQAKPDAFIKEISSDGNINTVDFIFQTYPIFLSLNPEYLRLLLQPILAHLAAEQWPQSWVIHDLGTSK